MKTLGIMSMMTAAIIGAYSLGGGNIEPLMNRAKGVGEYFELVERTPREVIIGLDITAGREGQLERDRQAIGEIIHRAGQGDRIAVYLIHSRAESEQEEVFTMALPETPGPAGQVLLRAKRDAENSWQACWDKNILPLMRSDRMQRTDIFGFMRFVATQKPEFTSNPNAWLVLFTDGQHVGDGFNMEKRAPGEAELERAEKLEFIPALGGVRLQFAGVTPTHGIDNSHWRKIQSFWKDYGKRTGAKSVNVTSERNFKV